MDKIFVLKIQFICPDWSEQDEIEKCNMINNLKDGITAEIKTMNVIPHSIRIEAYS